MGRRTRSVRRDLDSKPGLCLPSAALASLRPTGASPALPVVHPLGGPIAGDDPGICFHFVPAGQRTEHPVSIPAFSGWGNLFPANHPDIGYRPAVCLGVVPAGLHLPALGEGKMGMGQFPALRIGT